MNVSCFSILLDIADAAFETHVDLVSEVSLADVKDEESTKYSTDNNNDCTLVWNFKSPAIYPKPNITCGYYSYDFDDVTTHLPAGLSLHQMMNGSWQAVFDHTIVEVKIIYFLYFL